MGRLAIMIVATVSLLASGCGEAEQIKSELAIANARVVALDSALTSAQRDLGETMAHVANLDQSLQTARTERDRLTELLGSATERFNYLEAELSDLRGTSQASIDSLEAQNMALEIDLNRWKAEHENSSIRILASERQVIRLNRSRDSLIQFVDAVRPWYDYYVQEADRSWTKKLFGAGKIPIPENPEPPLTLNGVSPELEVQR